MPVSKNRKGHAKKAIARKTRERERKAHLENMYKQMLFQLRDKNTSMTEMLNKEDQASPPSNPEQVTIDGETYITVDATPRDPSEPVSIYSPRVVLSDEEQAIQDHIQESAVITTYP